MDVPGTARVQMLWLACLCGLVIDGREAHPWGPPPPSPHRIQASRTVDGSLASFRESRSLPRQASTARLGTQSTVRLTHKASSARAISTL